MLLYCIPSQKSLTRAGHATLSYMHNTASCQIRHDSCLHLLRRGNFVMGGFACALLTIDSTLRRKGHHQQCLAEFCRDSSTGHFWASRSPLAKAATKDYMTTERFETNKFMVLEKGWGWQALLGSGCISVGSGLQPALPPSHSSQTRAQVRGYQGQSQGSACRKAWMLRGSCTGGLGDAQLPEMRVSTCTRVPVGTF